MLTPVAPEDGAGEQLRGLRPAGVIAHVYTDALAAALRDRAAAALGPAAAGVARLLAEAGPRDRPD